jgi:small neutral amino acid transporter SnatA (MarC family)
LKLVRCPRSLAPAPRRFTFYVAEPLSSILFLFGVQMLFGKMDSKTERSPEEGRDLAVFPLAVPSIAGPGAMMAAIVLTDNGVYTVPERMETGVVLLWFSS